MWGPVSRYLLPLVAFWIIRHNLANEQNYAELPYCATYIVPPAVFVSTLDGKLTALNSLGEFMWDLETGPGPLLVSNIHKLELTNNGQWIRLIPSLSGSLYKFNGKTVDAIPITADNLLKSSFVYSDDTVIAGGREVRTYGLSMSSGEHLYECTLMGCKNKTDSPSNFENVVVIERSTITVRAHEPRTGNERWNFSVGLHNIKVPHISCIQYNGEIMELNLTAVLPKGELRSFNKLGELWRYTFDSPIVSVWKFNGRDVIHVDLFDAQTQQYENNLSPAIYLGMHNKQPYIHESERMQNALQYLNYASKNPSVEVVDSDTIATMPWKPIGANDLAIIPAENNDITSRSILYSSEYANGNGYYLFTEKDLEKKNNMSCKTSQYFINHNGASYSFGVLLNWWKEAFIIAGTVFLVNLYFSGQFLHFRRQRPVLPLHDSTPVIIDTLPIINKEKERTVSESSNAPFKSRFVEEFDTVRCLGRGGFGIVFEVKQKIDKCGYAIKRIRLPLEKSSRERVMREVISLARLDDKHIVRYYNSWIEEPPVGWEKEHDIPWTQDLTEGTTEISRTNTAITHTHNRNPSLSTIIDVTVSSTFSTDESIQTKHTNDDESSDDDSDIIFHKSATSDLDKSDSIVFEHSENHVEEEEDELDEEEEAFSVQVMNSKNLSATSPPVFLYIQMQLCQKDSLKEWLLTNQKREYAVVFSFFTQIVEAVHYIHHKNLIHRDLKPGNIFFSIDGTIKVGDFGLVTEMQDCDLSDSFSGEMSFRNHTKDAGTRLYMSPEQIDRHPYNFKVDIYSLGMIFFELLVPFSTDMERHSTLLDLRNAKYPNDFLSEYPKETELLKLMLSKTPDQRPTTTEIKKNITAFNQSDDSN